MAFFEALGVPLKTERGNRVFPVSDRAFDISGALERRLRKLRVAIVRDRASALETNDGAVTGVTGERGSYPAQAVILATGGVSYPATGSTGDGPSPGGGGRALRNASPGIPGAFGGTPGGERILRPAPGVEPAERGPDRL